MPLIECDRHSLRDLEHWSRYARLDSIRPRTIAWKRLVVNAADTIERFAAEGLCFVGTSWGKDSMVIAHMARSISRSIPLVWITIGGHDNPHCRLVRDAFIERFPGAYHEVHTPGVVAVNGDLPTGARRPGYAAASAQFGRRRVSGVRAEESRTRKLRMARWGASTGHTCAPIGWWTADDVFAYLAHYNLPIHPAYAMSMNGALDRRNIRVASLGGVRGTGHGRREWERWYYGSELRELGIK